MMKLTEHVNMARMEERFIAALQDEHMTTEQADTLAKLVWGPSAAAFNYGGTLYRVGNGPTDLVSTVYANSRKSYADAFFIALTSSSQYMVYDGGML